MKLIDSPKKRLAWYSRNYFYAATIAVVLTNILLYALLDYYWEGAYGNGHVSWGKSFDFERILRCFLNNFSHGNWQHVLLNMLCFFVAGLYLERKTGSLGLLGLVLSVAVLEGCVCTAANGGMGFRGKPAPAEPTSFEDRLKQFMATSDSKLSELRQAERRSSRRGGRK